MRADILHAQERLRKELGQDSRLFAYPYGEYDERVKKLVAELGYIGFGQQSGPLWKGDDWEALPRFPMSGRYADLKEFAVRALSLPLPVVSAQPDDPVLPISEARPVLKLSLATGDYRADALACYAGADRTMLRWLDRDKRLLEIQTSKPLPVGRSKYTCTAPNDDGTRFYWYTQLWIRRQPDGTWYRE